MVHSVNISIPLYRHNELTNYRIVEIFDSGSKTCLATIKDVTTDNVHHIRLNRDWIENNKYYPKDNIEGINIGRDIVDFIDINYFEKF